MAELNFNANIPFPPATTTTQTPPHITPGSPIDQFLSRTQANLTAQADAEPVIPPQAAPVTTFWPEDLNVVTAAELVVPESEAARFPVEPVINPEYEIVSKALIESKPEIETPVKRGPGRPKGSGKPKQENSLRTKELYSRYMATCAYRKEQQVVLDKMVADAIAAYAASKGAQK